MSKRSKNYKESKEKIESKVYSLEEGLDKTLETAKTKFDESIELHLRLGIDPSKGDQLVRGTTTLPHGTGKTMKVAAFVPEDKQAEVKGAGADLVGGEELIEEISNSKKCDFDIAVATPDMMRFLGKIARILGPKGLMPNPKNETVTPDPAKIIKELKAGKVSFRNDEGANLHQLVGKVSFGKDKLLENIEAFVKVVKSAKPTSSKGIYIKNAVLCSTMGPSVKIKI
ncbi:50S ribosomal protein L1 [Patescibacteria group bacterium]|nr:50S ribosomal protein L1 [Patescibacteria group bacterium]